MKKQIEAGETLKIVGIVCPREGASATTLSPGIAYTQELTEYVIEQAEKSRIVQEQLTNEDRNVFSGKEFGSEESGSQLKMEDMVTIDQEMLSSAFGMNLSMDGVMALLQSYMGSVSGSLNVDTAPAQQAFLSAFSDLCRDMLYTQLISHADDSGSMKLYLADAGEMVSTYLAGSAAQEKLNALAAGTNRSRNELINLLLDYAIENCEVK
jgi:hypothetical protein